MINNDEMDIMGSMKMIENYKNYLLSSVTDLFFTMAKGSQSNIDDVTDEISEIIILSYLIGKRLGINYSAIDERVIKKIRLGLLDENNIERDTQDYSKLISYIKEGREL